jgi:hypothetical protein
MTSNHSVYDANHAERLEFTALDATALGQVTTMRSMVDRETPTGLDQFYAKLPTMPQDRAR